MTSDPFASYQPFTEAEVVLPGAWNVTERHAVPKKDQPNSHPDCNAPTSQVHPNPDRKVQDVSSLNSGRQAPVCRPLFRQDGPKESPHG